ncbi:MAG: 1-acyl-sn-glycerol-3-phosphate acyltransferase, partial [Bacteroidetes bacterium]|nr:1-acyl-sn-glycerol-3-phosphate acyltransferase [Bacteroidota bacterium]
MSKEQDVESNIPKSFPPVVPDIREWPIYKMAKDREKLIDVVVKRTEDELFEHLSKGNGLLRNIADIYYQERVRLQENPWKVDPKDDPAFWKRVRNKLQRLAQPGHEDPEAVRALLHEIVERVILVPTHFSNLDSIVIGWAIETLGLPAFTYGAGINLFGHPILAYFMSRLGAFRVDRRKKNKAYLTVLKSYSEEVLLRKGHMLFFPGGTRSRSGSLESRFKLGLLGTAIETQRKLLLEGN